jgi:hypothetical protein
MTRRAGPRHVRKKGRVMTKPTVYWASVALLALVTIGSSSAQAKYVVRFEEVGQNVIETGSGALNVSDLTNLGGSITHKAAVVPNDPFFSSGAMGAELQVFVGDLTGPNDFGAGPETFADQSSGDGVGVFKSDSFSLLLPLGYTSGSPLIAHPRAFDLGDVAAWLRRTRLRQHQTQPRIAHDPLTGEQVFRQTHFPLSIVADTTLVANGARWRSAPAGQKLATAACFPLR